MRQLSTIGNLRAIRDPRRTAHLMQYHRGMGALGDGSATAAAVAMNDALAAHGYALADLPVYKAFAAAAGLSNPYPGPVLMKALQDELFAAGIGYDGPTTIYPWRDLGKGTGNYDGVNAPSWAQWNGGASSSSPSTSGGGSAPLTLPQDRITAHKDEPTSWLGILLAVGAAGLVAFLVVRAMQSRKRRRAAFLLTA